MTNKTTEIRKHLLEKKNITSMEAIELYGETRLSAIIFNLRKKGYNIVNMNETGIDRYGNECRYVRYVFMGISGSTEDKKESFLKKIFGK